MAFNWLVFGHNRVVYKDAEDGKWTGDPLASHLNDIEGQMTILWIVESCFGAFNLVVITNTLWYFLVNQKRSVRSILGGLLRAVPARIYELDKINGSIVAELSDGCYLALKQTESGGGMYLQTQDITERLDTQTSSLIGFVEFDSAVLREPSGRIAIKHFANERKIVANFDDDAVFACGVGHIVEGNNLIQFTAQHGVCRSLIRLPHERLGEVPRAITSHYLVYDDAAYTIRTGCVELCLLSPHRVVEARGEGLLCDNGIIYVCYYDVTKILNKTPCLIPVHKHRKSAV